MDSYGYYELLSDIDHLDRLGAYAGYLGITYFGRRIPFVHLGKMCGNQIIIQGAIHAREFVTAKLVVEQAYYWLAKEWQLEGGVYFVPMVNPDGVMLCIDGIKSVPFKYQRQKLLGINGGNEDFTLWKANGNAVDLNTNFDARWGTGAQNVTYPAPANYIGTEPLSEPESSALAYFTKKVKPAATISYHCKGREIYWEFFQKPQNIERDRQIGVALAKETGYALIDGDLGSAGGYKDWCIQDFAIPAYTIEIIDSAVDFPVGTENLKDEWQNNKKVPALLGELISQQKR